MEDTTEYDLLLRSVFDSCDRNGMGFLSVAEFEDLCVQLSLEDEHAILHENLFNTKSLLSYERFKEALLLLLAGTPAEKGCEDGFETRTEDCIAAQHARGDSIGFSASEEDDGNQGNGDLNDNDVKRPCNAINEDSNKSRRDQIYGERADHSDWLVIDFHENSDNRATNRDEIRTSSPEHKKYRRYGRRTLPDYDLLKDNKVHNNHNQSNSKFDDVTIRSDHVMSSHTIEQEFVGEGDGSQWTNPEQSVFCHEDDAEMERTNETSANDAQEALGSIWRQIIGDLDENIDVEQLQALFHALSLTSSVGDVKQLFEVLDSDGDGLICFGDFARQMSVFLSGNSDVTEREENTNCEVTGINSDGNNRDLNKNNSDLHSTPYSNRTQTIQTPHAIDFTSPHTKSTPHHAQRNNSAVDTSPSTCHVTQSSVERNSTSGFMSSPSSTVSQNNFMTSNSDYRSPTPDSGRLQTDTYDNDVNCQDNMKSYHGAPSYRRRRRSNHNAPRRRRTNRTMNLPHYHPISKRHLEDCLLYFLTEENGRYVEVDNLRAIWREDGIEDTDQVLKDLGVNLDDSFSIEALSEVLESEVKENLVHQAACALYKSGIRYYRSQRDHVTSERNKVGSRTDHLDCQLQEQEERMEKMEVDHCLQLEEMENQYKDEITRLTFDLEAAQSKYRRINESEIVRLQNKIERLQEIEQDLQNELAVMERDNKELLLRHNQVENQLETSEANMERMRSDFESACHQMALCSHSHTKQQTRMESLLHEYRTGAEKLQDENDELNGQLEIMKKRWSSRDQIKSSKYHSSWNSSPSMPVEPLNHEASRAHSSEPINRNHSARNEISFIPVPTGSRGMFSDYTESPPRTSHKSMSWRLYNDPDVSIGQLPPPDALPDNLLKEMKSSSSSSVV